MDRAHGYLNANRYADALPLLEEACELNPGDGEAALWAAVACIALNRPEAAERYCATAARLNPDDFRVFLTWGQALVDRGRLEQALWRIEAAAIADESSAEPFLVAGQWLRNAAEERDSARGGKALSEAEEYFVRATKREPNLPAAWFELGSARNLKGAIDASLEALERSVDLDGSSVEARVKFAEVLLQAERPEDAMETLKTALTLVPNQLGASLEIRWYLAFALRQTRQFDHALIQAQEMLREAESIGRFSQHGQQTADNSDQAVTESRQWSQLLLASVLGDLKRYGEARDVLNAATSPPSSVVPFLMLSTAELLSRRGDYAGSWKSLADVDELVSRTPDGDPSTMLLRIQLQRLRGDYRGALELVEQELQGRPEDADLQAEELKVTAKLRDSDSEGSSWQWRLRQAFEQRKATLQARRERPSFALTLGWLHMLVNEDREARQHFAQAIKNDPADGNAHAFLGIVRLRLGEYSRAADSLRAALRRDPDNLDFKVALGQAYAQLGSPEAAERLYREVLGEAPTTIEALVGLAAVLNSRDDGDVETYQEAEARLLETARLAATMELDFEGREGSRPLTSKQLAAVHYGIGYSRVRQYESQGGRGISTKRIRMLDRARNSFVAAERMDPALTRAGQAKRAIDRSSIERVQPYAPLALGSVVVLLLGLLTTAFLFGWPRSVDQLTGTTYSALTLGLVLLLLAILSLPSLSKLSIAGGSLEKTPAAFEIPERFDLERDTTLVTALRAEFNAPHLPARDSTASKQAQAAVGIEGSESAAHPARSGLDHPS